MKRTLLAATAAALACLSLPASQSAAQQANNERIIHGTTVKPGTYPFQVLINARKRNGGIYMCGGSLIGDGTWVITAAHCVYDTDGNLIPAWQFSVSAGSVVYRGGNYINVTEVHAYKDYNPANQDGDFALLRLRTKPHGVNYSTIALLDPAQESDLDRDNTPVTVIGWGKMENDKTSDRLLEGHVQLVSRKQCNQNYVDYYMRGLEAYLGSIAQSGRNADNENFWLSSLRFDESNKARIRRMLDRNASSGEILTYAAGKAGTVITDNMMCALGSSPKANDEFVTDACHGDSGGPLFTAGKDGKPTLIALVSWGTGGRIGCGSPTEPGVYARVAKATNWINSVINK